MADLGQMPSPLLHLPLAPGVEEEDVAAQLDQHVWYHRIGLGRSIVTPGVQRYEPYQRRVLDAMAAEDLAGARVLDVSSRDGLFALAAEGAGAAEVIGIDNCISTGAVELLLPSVGSTVQMREMNLLDARPDDLGGTFDVVIFPGLLYHLRTPFEALRVLADLVRPGGSMIVETAVMLTSDRWADLWCPTGNDGPYDNTSPTFFNRRGLLDTLGAFGFVDADFSLLGERVQHPPGRRARLKRQVRWVDRAVVRCRREGSVELDDYFFGTHDRRVWS